VKCTARVGLEQQVKNVRALWLGIVVPGRNTNGVFKQHRA
jgi:hypothetical protein